MRKKSLKTAHEEPVNAQVAPEVPVDAQVLPPVLAPPPPPLAVNPAPILQPTPAPATTPAQKQKPFHYPSLLTLHPKLQYTSTEATVNFLNILSCQQVL